MKTIFKDLIKTKNSNKRITINKIKITEAQHLLREVVELQRLSFNKDSVKTHHLIKPWDVAREEFGKSAKHYHTSVEKLLKEVLRKRNVQAKDTLTNLLRYLSLRHIIPFGVDDTDKLEGNLTFSVASGNIVISNIVKMYFKPTSRFSIMWPLHFLRLNG